MSSAQSRRVVAKRYITSVMETVWDQLKGVPIRVSTVDFVSRLRQLNQSYPQLIYHLDQAVELAESPSPSYLQIQNHLLAARDEANQITDPPTNRFIPQQVITVEGRWHRRLW
jgi:hypothetical protein